MLKMSKSQKTGRHPCDHRRGFKLFAQDLVGRAHDGQSAGGGNAQAMHGFTA